MLILRHAFFGSEIGVVDGRILVGILLLAGQFRVVQAACVAERTGAIRPTSPLGSLSAVAAVTTSGGSGATPAFLGIRASESAFDVVLELHGGHGRFGICLLLLALLGGLLVVGDLLRYDDLANFR